MKGHKMRYTVKKLRQLVNCVNALYIQPEYNGTKGKFAINQAYGAYRIVNELPCGYCADISGMYRGSSRQCAMQLMEWLRTNDDVDLKTYRFITDVFEKQLERVPKVGTGV